MKNIRLLSYGTVIATAMCGAATAANIASSGTGILGVHSTIDATLGTPYVRGDQNIAVLSDGNYGTNGSFGAPPVLVDTWGANEPGQANLPPTLTHSYIGITGFSIPAGEQVSNIVVNLVGAGDGGWFGVNGSNSTAAANLVVPTVQITSDGGTTWMNALAGTNDYLGVMTDAPVGNPNPNYHTVSFDLDAPQAAIDGIRIIGVNAGSGDVNGFLGAAEFEVNTTTIPEPSALALAGLLGLGLIARRRR